MSSFRPVNNRIFKKRTLPVAFLNKAILSWKSQLFNVKVGRKDRPLVSFLLDDTGVTLESRTVTRSLSVVVDSHQQQIPLIVLQLLGILLPPDLLQRGVGGLIVFQLHQHRGNPGMPGRGKENEICISFSRVHFLNNRIILPGSVIGQLNGIAQRRFIVVGFVAGAVVRLFQQLRNLLRVPWPR